MSSGPHALSELRATIDRIDRDLVALLAERVRCLDKVVEVKTRENLPAAIPERVEEVVAHVRAQAQAAGMPPELAELLWRRLIDWSISYEERHLGGSNPGEAVKT